MPRHKTIWRNFAWIAAILAYLKMESTERGNPSLIIAAGSYEGLVFGWEARSNADADDNDAVFDMEMIFGFNLSGGTVKCCDISQTGRNIVLPTLSTHT